MFLLLDLVLHVKLGLPGNRQQPKPTSQNKNFSGKEGQIALKNAKSTLCFQGQRLQKGLPALRLF